VVGVVRDAANGAIWRDKEMGDLSPGAGLHGFTRRQADRAHYR
jgi:hypothetical protein